MLIGHTKFPSPQVRVAEATVFYSKNFKQNNCLPATFRLNTLTNLIHWLELFCAIATSTVLENWINYELNCSQRIRPERPLHWVSAPYGKLSSQKMKRYGKAITWNRGQDFVCQKIEIINGVSIADLDWVKFLSWKVIGYGESRWLQIYAYGLVYRGSQCST